jgi:hypothetical protein
MDMPDLEHRRTTNDHHQHQHHHQSAVSGITAKGGDAPPQLQVERPMPSGVSVATRTRKRSYSQQQQQAPASTLRIEGDYQEIRKPMAYRYSACVLVGYSHYFLVPHHNSAIRAQLKVRVDLNLLFQSKNRMIIQLIRMMIYSMMLISTN